MGLYVNPGNAGFKRALRSSIYVDKSLLIEYTNGVLDSEQGYICVSRPRRFGKSMAANMLCAYYSMDCDSSGLFDGLNIAEKESYRKHLNHHDVIYLNIQQFLSGAGSADFLVAYLQKEVLNELREVYGDWIAPGEKRLSQALASIFARNERKEKGFIFILDEWDCVFREAKDNKTAQKAYLDFLKDLFKDRTYVKLAYLTGILPIKKYGTHSALNIFEEFSMMDQGVLAPFTGFTEEEVKELCVQYGRNFEEAKRWYDGYHFAENLHVYNPKAIVDVMRSGKFKNYWIGTETYEALKIYIDMNFDGLKDAVIIMLGGGSVRINSRTFQNDMTSFESRDDVLTLLMHLGYLAYNEADQTVCIPNVEILNEFQNAVEGSNGWERLVEIMHNSDMLLDATWNQNEEEVANGIDRIHEENVSILSYHNENSLSCVITLVYISAQREYTLIRELPTGKGFADIVFLPRKASDKPAMIVELKWDKDAEGALSQIKEKRYGATLKEYTGKLLLVGINYDRKTKLHRCRIEEVTR